MNSENRGGMLKPFIYTDEIDEKAIKIEKYGNRELENYYYDFDLDQFYHREEDGKYRLLPVIRLKCGFEFVGIRDKNNTEIVFVVNKFKKLYDLE